MQVPIPCDRDRPAVALSSVQAAHYLYSHVTRLLSRAVARINRHTASGFAVVTKPKTKTMLTY